MKKFVTFSNFMVLLGIMTIFFYFIPAVKITPHVFVQYSASVNLFTAAFGGTFSLAYPGGQNLPLIATGGLIVAFFLGLIGIVLTFLRCKNRLANLLAFPFYLTSGILTACTATMVRNVNANTLLANNFTYKTLGGATTVTTFFFILAGLALIEFIATVAKPKQPQNPAY